MSDGAAASATGADGGGADVRRTAGSPELYLYWRARSAGLERALEAARGWQRELAACHPGLECRLLRRDEAGPATVMEIYRRTGGIDPVLLDEIHRGGDSLLAPWLDGARHLERFAPA